jgi:ABC-type Fe3+/spermidine/putrescine transport system ATPase subunit
LLSDLTAAIEELVLRALPALKLVDLKKTFRRGAVTAVDGVSLEVDGDEIVSILGPSGCGKTTTMRIMAGLERPDSGEILLHGRSVLDIPVHKRNIGLVFQDLALFSHRSVRDNVGFGLRMKGLKGDALRRRVDSALELVELPPPRFGDRMPSELSGGQRQRVAVARTIVVEPALVLFDEPMAALDRRLRDRMALELRRITKQLGVPAIYVTHDQETASMISDRIAVMLDGRLVQVGAPLDVYRAPTTRFVADFIGDMNFLPATVVNGKAGSMLDVAGCQIAVSTLDAPIGSKVTLAVRPEHVVLVTERVEPAIGEAVVKSVHFVGGAFIHRLVLENGSELLARSPRNEAVDRQRLWITADPDDLHVLGD